jgi:hypothetical protein
LKKVSYTLFQLKGLVIWGVTEGRGKSLTQEGRGVVVVTPFKFFNPLHDLLFVQQKV